MTPHYLQGAQAARVGTLLLSIYYDWSTRLDVLLISALILSFSFRYYVVQVHRNGRHTKWAGSQNG